MPRVITVKLFISSVPFWGLLVASHWVPWGFRLVVMMAAAAGIVVFTVLGGINALLGRLLGTAAERALRDKAVRRIGEALVASQRAATAPQPVLRVLP